MTYTINTVSVNEDTALLVNAELFSIPFYAGEFNWDIAIEPEPIASGIYASEFLLNIGANQYALAVNCYFDDCELSRIKLNIRTFDYDSPCEGDCLVKHDLENMSPQQLIGLARCLLQASSEFLTDL